MPVIKNPELVEKHAMKLYGCSSAEAIALNNGLGLREKGSFSMSYLASWSAFSLLRSA